MPQTPYEMIKAHYDASARGDLAAMLAPLGPQTRWTEMAGFPCAGTYIGPEAVVAGVFEVLGRDWEGFGFTLERLIDGGETIVGVGTYAGTYRQTGKHMSARVTHVWDLKDGTVVNFEQFTDTLLVNQAMRA
ncbi:nuclear transport factor 2 family protein [Cognatishimia sp. SS12]|uniref:nuclear transport factor 2 family protein n=1 Tax=Cognatishimia sp. SS12 TaxID=2979465 RepID=UPI0023311733|nr:nuclear transport factor 2 family protein [Cognatishimia sp. SS12]MDC0739332.1 nuclear transport factor 2 family protein [Cognatishimia sp. SS12]